MSNKPRTTKTPFSMLPVMMFHNDVRIPVPASIAVAVVVAVGVDEEVGVVPAVATEGMVRFDSSEGVV